MGVWLGGCRYGNRKSEKSPFTERLPGKKPTTNFTFITHPKSWIRDYSGRGLIPALGTDFPILQRHLTELPKNINTQTMDKLVGHSRMGYLEQLRGRAHRRIDGTILPFTFWHGLQTEAGVQAASNIMSTISDEVFDPEVGGQILDPSKVSLEDIEAMQKAVEDQLKSGLGPVADALDAIKETEDAILPDII